MQVPRIDGEICVSCGICAYVCPAGVIEAKSAPRVAKPEACIDGCMECVDNCPTLAIEIVQQ